MVESSTVQIGNLERKGARRTLTGGVWLIVLVILVWAWRGAEMDPWVLFRDSGNSLEIGREFLHPNFHEWRFYLGELVVTLQMAIWGTVLAIVFAIPFGLLSADNLMPWWVYQPVRRMMDVLRSINEMVFAMLFVTAVGLGPFSGVLALFVHTTGVLAKLFSEAVEAIDPRPVEGIRATGANKLEEILYGVIPQVIPLWISYSLYRFEANVRSATVVGLTGAGGVGVVLYEDIRGFRFGEASAVMLMIIAAVVAIDLSSARLRKLFI
jgi:phosphonate transport system permease protein